MNDHNQYNYVNPNNLSLDSWLDREIIEPFSIRDNELNFKTKDIWNALKQQNWYYPNSN